MHVEIVSTGSRTSDKNTLFIQLSELNSHQFAYYSARAQSSSQSVTFQGRHSIPIQRHFIKIRTKVVSPGPLGFLFKDAPVIAPSSSIYKQFGQSSEKSTTKKNQIATCLDLNRDPTADQYQERYPTSCSSFTYFNGILKINRRVMVTVKVFFKMPTVP